jgi:hydrogenase expression/formation protein HypC
MCLGEIGQVSSLIDETTAEVAVGPRRSRVSLLTLDGRVAVGEWLLVHSGFALARLDPAAADEAQRIRSTGQEGHL